MVQVPWKLEASRNFCPILSTFAMSFEMIIFTLHVVPFIIVLKFSICIHSWGLWMKGTVIAEQSQIALHQMAKTNWKKKLLITYNLQQQILGYHVKFKVCLVSKPLIHVVLSNFCKLREKHFLCRLFNRNLQFSFLHYVNYQTSCHCCLPQCSALARNSDLCIDN